MRVKQNLDSEIIEITEGDTVLSVKLRGQDQLGIAARKITVRGQFDGVKTDDHKMIKKKK